MAGNIPDDRVSHHRTFKVGDRVRVQLGRQTLPGIIVEDRGFIASGGRHLFRVEVDFDPPNVTTLELPEDELSAA